LAELVLTVPLETALAELSFWDLTRIKHGRRTKSQETLSVLTLKAAVASISAKSQLEITAPPPKKKIPEKSALKQEQWKAH
jgi:hypothetical protein